MDKVGRYIIGFVMIGVAYILYHFGMQSEETCLIISVIGALIVAPRLVFASACFVIGFFFKGIFSLGMGTWRRY